MARPRKSTGGKTPFGKRSEAQKSFHDRKKRSGRGDDGRPRNFTRGEDSENRSKPNRFGTSKPSFKRNESGSKPRFSKPFSSDGDEKKPFRKTGSGPFSSRSSGTSRFGKKSFERRDNQDEKPFRKKEGGPFEKRNERPSRFGNKSFDKKESGTEKPFRKSSGSFERSNERSSRFVKKSFDKRGDRTEKPFKKSDDNSLESGNERTPRFVKKSFSRREDGNSERPFRKKSNSESGEGSEKGYGKGSNFGLPYKRKPYKARGVKSSVRSKADQKPKTDSDLIRLNKFLSNSGVGSRREADEYIKMGLVSVNGVTITEMGYKVKLTDDVRYEGRKLKAEKPVYILLNKPKGFITTTDDPQDRNTVMSLVANAGPERIYPVGRLDRNTTGLLLLTNDGDLADKLTHPSYEVKKIYRVELDKPLSKNDFIKIKEGVRLEEGRAMVDDLAIVDGDNKTIGIELHIGWNRIVRRIFESLGYDVVKLDRVVYAGLDKKDLGRGQWRFLKPEEVVMLKHFK